MSVDTPTDPTGLLIFIAVSMVGLVVFMVRTYRTVNTDDTALRQAVDHIRIDVEKLVAAQDKFQSKGWATLPDDIGTAARLTEKIRQLEHDAEMSRTAHEDISAQLSKLQASVDAHVQWEMTQKYRGDD